MNRRSTPSSVKCVINVICTFSEKVQITWATELANSEVSVYTLMKLLGHESMVTSQRYVTAAGTETRTAAAQNKLYGFLADDR
jgi:integrase